MTIDAGTRQGAMLVGCGCPSEVWVSSEIWSLVASMALPSYVRSGLYYLSSPAL